MGIPRWTQDLTAYLEAGVVTTKPDNESRLIFRNVVIDGPSLVFHVYNALALSGHAITAGSLNEPTYVQLNSAIDVFLTDLESCGAKIEGIFFDGALPLSKRSTRIDRLEKSRMQLERLKLLGPPPRPLTLPGDFDRNQLSTVLWQTKPSLSGSSSFIGPFIVPSTIEHLTTSKWKDSVFVVNGEAENSCASIAKTTGATVLTNDSDLTLLADMQDGQIVGLLRSMSMHTSPDGASSTIEIQCWRPKHIATRLGVPNLLRVGFERSKDPTASFATVLQRSQDGKSQPCTVSIEFERFTEQFKSCMETDATMETNGYLKVSQLDPRVAELVCQLVEAKTSSAAFKTNEFWVTLPILLEDFSKDASWTYGREMRRLAYSLILFSYSEMREGTYSVTESSRKGPRIAQDVIETIHPAELSDAVRSCIADLASLPRSTGSSITPRNNSSREYVLWALGSVLKQRAAAGKNVVPSNTIREYLGITENLDPGPSLVSKRARVPDQEGEWRLVHLNANVHSALYSLRILRQICGLLRGSTMITDCEDDLVRLSELLQSMPAIQDLFLDIEKVKTLMQQSPLSESDQAFDDILRYSGHPLHVLSLSKVDVKTVSAPATGKNARKRSKKRRLAENKADNQHKEAKPRNSPSTNPFDLLIERI